MYDVSTVEANDAVAAYDADSAGFVLVCTDPVTYDAVTALLAQLAVPINAPVKDPVKEAVTDVTFIAVGR